MAQDEEGVLEAHSSSPPQSSLATSSCLALGQAHQACQGQVLPPSYSLRAPPREVAQDEEVVLEADSPQALPSPSLALGQTHQACERPSVPPSCSLEACGPPVAQD